MAKYLTFAGGWNRETKNGDAFVSCSAKGQYARLYDADTKKYENCPVEIIIRTVDSGEELPLDSFIVVPNNNQRDGKNDPQFDVKVKIGE